MKWGSRVRAYRIGLDWSVERLALEINRDRKTIHRLENCENICIRTYMRIVKLWPELLEDEKVPS